jgi:hypothetical protein
MTGIFTYTTLFVVGIIENFLTIFFAFFLKKMIKKTFSHCFPKVSCCYFILFCYLVALSSRVYFSMKINIYYGTNRRSLFFFYHNLHRTLYG